jgi:hypothetical protein
VSHSPEEDIARTFLYYATTSLIENNIFIYLLLDSTKENPFMFIAREGGHKIRLALRTPFFLSFFLLFFFDNVNIECFFFLISYFIAESRRSLDHFLLNLHEGV